MHLRYAVHFIGSNGVVTCMRCSTVHPTDPIHRNRTNRMHKKAKRTKKKEAKKKAKQQHVRVVYARAHAIMFMPHRITHIRTRHGHKRHDDDDDAHAVRMQQASGENTHRYL